MLGGYLVAYLNLDKVIKIIRSEDEPKPVLMKTFKLSDVQADAILNMRLRNLRRLEEMEIREEDKALRAEKKSHRGVDALREAAMEDDRRTDPRGARQIRAENAARQAPHRLCRGAGARRGGDRGGPGRARADHRGGVRERLDPRAARPGRRPVQPRLQGRRRAQARLLRRDHVETSRSSPPTAAATPSRRRNCRAGAAMASRSGCSSISSRRPT